MLEHFTHTNNITLSAVGRTLGLLCLLIFFPGLASAANISAQPDSVFLLAYSKDEGKSGLLLAWSNDKKNWYGIGPDHRFLFSDFGSWGTQKRMFAPDLFQDEKGVWHCVWSLNDNVQQFAHAASANLYDWGRQSYPVVMKSGSVSNPEISGKNGKFLITWQHEEGESNGYYQTTTTDFKNYAPTTAVADKERLNRRVKAEIDGTTYEGVVNKVSWGLVDDLIKNYQWTKFHESEKAEKMADDPVRFASLKPVNAEISLRPSERKQISDMLIGAFFEDISYAADGGLYAELVQNRDFEYKPSEKKGKDKNWNHTTAWVLEGDNASFRIDSLNPIHPNNKYYAVLDVKQLGKGLVNEGFDGIALKAGEKYNFSAFAKAIDSKSNTLTVRLTDKNGRNLAETKINNIGTAWKKYNATLMTKETVADAKIAVVPQKAGKVGLDMISLFPQNTFNGRKNGLRKDLAQTIADLHPKFMRFPGGCVAHGDGIENIYRWKNTIGPLEGRVPMRNLWGYHQSMGLGYYEYFQFCEDIGAEPVPVLAAGVPCQNSSTGGHGQQGGIPMADMDEYVQDVLDLIEWANGDKNTTWGKKRIEAGHPEPFNLKYVGIGNEDLITDIFEERFTMIFNAVKEKHPEITVIGTVGPFYMGTDYDEGWALARKLQVPMVDEHYYQSPGWFINNQDFYDRYDRAGTKVYLGEYAAFVDDRRMNIESALSEALYLSAIERNGDVVSMTSFAPLLAKEHHTSWNPDLIYFNNTEVKPTVDYYVQKLYSLNSGDTYVPAKVELTEKQENVQKRIGVSVVQDTRSKDLIVKLVNLLPVDVNSALDLSAFNMAGKEATLTVLQGKPTDENVMPKESTVQVSEKLKYQLPAYSFSVIRIKTK
ncbi:alpha-L-arabinofuranosidase C-terminal domain-containing protein [Pontibacter silvestris]|uniref:non-reducing end alpha-L-arabinofuranosidase n=1 Tax=Pontibacter silvestris TaxID=2305183 RepID=A0ABW4WYW6_9BACT|nr:alpha-L-arabinofuranosidase C-terminal domain-containing protein [Pontibacter silvestris]MCC9135606.1 carbohydrate binding domain-containing protein [Pontibacter silvestris]